MATLKEMLDFSGTFDMAEFIARKMFNDGVKDALIDLRLLYMAQGKFDDVVKLDEEIDKNFNNDPRITFNRSWWKLRDGDLQGGLKMMEAGRGLHNFGKDPMQTQMPQWDGNFDIRGKHVIMWGEGGYGDEISSVRCVNTLSEMGAKPIIACSPHLVSLFSRMSSASAIVSKEAANYVYHDCWYPGMSGPRLCKYTYQNLPNDSYLKAHPSLLESWKKILSHPGKRIGIRWAGNPGFEDEKFRKFPIENIISLADINGTQFYSFQRDSDMIQVPSNIIDLSPVLKSWEDTAAALSCMDLVITSCTSVAHLSGALGIPTWIIVPIYCFYLWALPGETSPWYKSVTLFRQTIFGNWDSPFEDIRKRLETENSQLNSAKGEA